MNTSSSAKAGEGQPQYGQMPNLNLAEEEITALVAFLNEPEARTTRR